MDEIDEATQKHIAEMIKEGYTSGEIVMEGKRGWWKLETTVWDTK